MYLEPEKFFEFFEKSMKGDFSPIINYLYDNLSYHEQEIFYNKTDFIFNILKHAEPEKKAKIATEFLRHKEYKFIDLNELSEENKNILKSFWDIPKQFNINKFSSPLMLVPLLNKDDENTNNDIFNYWNMNVCFSNKENNQDAQDLKKIYPYIIKKLFSIKHTKLLNCLESFYEFQNYVSSEEFSDKENIQKSCKENTINNPELFLSYSRLYNPFFSDFVREYLQIQHKNKENITSFIKHVFPELSDYSKEVFLFESLKASPSKKLFQHILQEGFQTKKIEKINIDNKNLFYNALKEHKDKSLMIDYLNNGFIKPFEYLKNESKFTIQFLVNDFKEAESLSLNNPINKNIFIKNFFTPIPETNDNFFSIAAKDSDNFFYPVLNVNFETLEIKLNEIDKNYPNKKYSELHEVEKLEILTDFLERTWFSKTPSYTKEYYEKNKKETILSEMLNRHYSRIEEKIWVLDEYIDLTKKLNLKNEFLKNYTELISYQFGEKINVLKYVWKTTSYTEQCSNIIDYLNDNPNTDWSYIKEQISQSKNEEMKETIAPIFQKLMYNCLAKTANQTPIKETKQFKI